MRDLLRAGCAGLVLATLTLGGHSWSAAPKVSAPRPRSRVALVNLSHVISNYEKMNAYRNHLKVAFGPFQTKEASIRTAATKLTQEAKDVKTTAERSLRIAQHLEELKGEMEKLKTDFNKMMGKTQEQQAKVVYKDIENAVRDHAKVHDIELVLHYNDAIKPADLDNPQNIMRKMQMGARAPLYMVPGIDISNEIIAALNAKWRQRKDR